VSIGPGKYDEVCTIVREETDADCVVVMVIGGKKGDGFSCQVTDLQMMKGLPELLEDMARQIREDHRS
jgi:hypothetical protein